MLEPYIIGGVIALSFSHTFRFVLNMVYAATGMDHDPQDAAKIGMVMNALAVCFYSTLAVIAVVLS